MERSTVNEAYSGGLRNASNLHFREQTPEDAARQRDEATLEFEGRIRLSLDDELKCDPYNRRGRLAAIAERDSRRASVANESVAAGD